jgi:hypothetical protein
MSGIPLVCWKRIVRDVGFLCLLEGEFVMCIVKLKGQIESTGFQKKKSGRLL